MTDTNDNDLDDLDAALASIDVDFQMSFLDRSNIDNDSTDDNQDDKQDDLPAETKAVEAVEAVTISDEEYHQQQLQRPEVFSHRYRPTRDEQEQVDQLCRSLHVGTKVTWGSDRTVHQLLNHDVTLLNIILQHGKVSLLSDATQQRELILLTHGFILTKDSFTFTGTSTAAGIFSNLCDMAELYTNVLYIKDLWMTPSNQSFCLKLTNGKEILLSSNQKKMWLEAFERVLLQHHLHSKIKNDDRQFGWQYHLVQTSVYTAAVTGASFFSQEHLNKMNVLDDYNQMAPLHYAAMYNHAHIITALLEYGADPEVKDGDGRTPMYYAQRDEHKLAEEALRDHGATESALLHQEQHGELAHNVADVEEGRRQKAEAEVAAKKEELFVGAAVEGNGTTNKSFFETAFAGFASEECGNVSQVEGIKHHATAAHSQMSENMRLIHERGDKINELGDKADKLEENINEYGSLAAQLKAKMQKENDRLSLPFSIPKVSLPKFKKPFK